MITAQDMLAPLTVPADDVCIHADEPPDGLLVRDLGEPTRVQCPDCLERSAAWARCGSCSAVPVSWVVEVGNVVIGDLSISVTAALCAVCVGVLPKGLTTWTLDADGEMHIHQPGAE